MDKSNSEGRKDNAAQPLGERQGPASHKQTAAIGKAERKSAGPDGPDAKVIGNTFKE